MKRIVGLLLAICIILSVLALTVFAITQNDAVSWARDQQYRTGNCDVDGNGLWCTDLATAYINYCWLRNNGDNRDPWGTYPYTTKNAKDYVNYLSGKSEWTIISRTTSTTPKAGDLFVSEQDEVGANAGHIGIVLTPYGSSSAEVIEMSAGMKPRVRTITWGQSPSYQAEHLIRFNYFQQENPRPAKPVISVQSSQLEGYPITVRWTIGANTTHCNFWLYKKNGSTWDVADIIDYAGNSVTETNLSAGDYRVLIVATNSNAWEADGSTWMYQNSDYAYFTVEHDYFATYIGPTCTSDGYWKYTCDVCGYSYISLDSVAPALGHSFGAWKQKVAPTCTENGSETRTCSRCGKVETRTVYAYGHDFYTERTEATCTTDGIVEQVCSRCWLRNTIQVIPAYGHNWQVTTDGFWTKYTCLNCGWSYSFIDQPLPAPPALPCNGDSNCPGKVFTDMPPKSNWAHDAIDWAVVHGVTTGTSKTTFSPEAGCTRSQVVTFLWRAAGSPEPASGNNPFTDVQSGQFCYKAVLWAVEQGITTGTSKTTFDPVMQCTRSQIVTFLWRYEGSPAPKTTNNPFTDVKPGAYYAKAVLWAAETGVTSGTSKTTFSPEATCTRAQVVTFLYRATK